MIGTDLELAADLLRSGQLVAIPTETVYGLAGNALDTKAVARIFEVKNRPSFDPLIVHTHQVEEIQKYTRQIPPMAMNLAREFMPGPLTLLLEKNELIPDLVTAGSHRVAVRIPSHPMTLHLLQMLNFPLAAPSANPFGYISPTSAEHVEAQLGHKIPYILDGGSCEIGLESTILGFEAGQVVVYRKGGIPLEAIEKIAGNLKVRTHSTSNPASPGLLKSHYAPAVRVILGDIDQLMSTFSGQKIGLLAFSRKRLAVPENQQWILSEVGDLNQAAQRLFEGMRYLDSLDLDIILAEMVPENGLGLAINDRLTRAAALE